MKKILLLVFLFVSANCFSQTTIYYKLNPTLMWDAPTEYENGDPFLLEDIISYEVFLWNTALGAIEDQEIENLNYFGTTLNKEIVLSFPNRYNWAAAVRMRVTDGDGNTEISSLAYTTTPEDTNNLPFAYAPDIPVILQKLQNLRDSGI